MFRKIHSNRDPQATIFSELQKEFLPYYDRARNGMRRIADSYPRFLFVMMVVNITLSIILTVTVFKRKGDIPRHKTVNVASPLVNGFERIRLANAALRETIKLKRRIDSLTHLKTLSHADSAALLAYLDSLRNIRLTTHP